MNPSVKRQRISFTLEDKIDVINRLENGEHIAYVARSTDLDESTVRAIRDNASKIKELQRALTESVLHYTKNNVMEDMEHLLTAWIETENKRDELLTPGLIMEKAKALYRNLKSKSNDPNIKPFIASHEWLNQFKSRANLHHIQWSGDDILGDDEAGNDFSDVVAQSNSSCDAQQLNNMTKQITFVSVKDIEKVIIKEETLNSDDAELEDCQLTRKKRKKKLKKKNFDTDESDPSEEKTKQAIRFQYTEEQMKNALEACKAGGLTVQKASKLFGVPRSTLSDKMKGRTPEERIIGRVSYLNKHEKHVVEWIMEEVKQGYPVKKTDIINSVQAILKANKIMNTPFVNYRPGDTWFKSFMKRNASIRIPERATIAGTDVTEETIQGWCEALRRRLEEVGHMDIFNHSNRVFNCDEVNMKVCPTTGKVLGIKGWRNVYEISTEQESNTLTFLSTFSAGGEMVVPLIIFQYLRIPSDIMNSVPDGWAVGATEHGWMNSGTFYEFLCNSFIPMVQERRIKLPVLLFVDGHKTHITMQTSEKCKEAGIILCNRPIYSTHVLQPTNADCFKPLTSFWTTLLRDWYGKKKNYNRKHVATLLNDALSKISKLHIQKSFRMCGLYPLDPKAIEYVKRLPLETNVAQSNRAGKKSHPFSQEDLKTTLSVMEAFLGSKVNELKQFVKATEFSELHKLWLEIKREIATNEETSNH